MKLALLSDIHSNYIALRACLDHLASEKFDRLCMLGDIIAYGPRAKECLDTLRALNLKGALCLKGNHDDNVVRQEVPQGVSQDIGLVGAGQALDGRAVESDALVEGALDLGRGESHRLQGAHHIREPQAYELDAALLDRAENEVTLLVHGGPFRCECRRLRSPAGR